MASTNTQRDIAGSIAPEIVTAATLSSTRQSTPSPKSAVPWDSYPGGKGADGTFQTLINLIPPHVDYHEPFLGGGAILRMKRPAERYNVGHEINPAVVNQWHDYLIDAEINGITVREDDGLEYLRSWSPRRSNIRTFFFIDPPYLDETLKTGRAPYPHRFTFDKHIALLQHLKRIHKEHGETTCIMLCGLPNLQTENHLEGWHTLQYQNKTRKGMQTEQVWMNYPAPEVLHDYRFLGDNYRERERIKRKQNNLLKSLENLAVTERNAILDLIERTYQLSASKP